MPQRKIKFSPNEFYHIYNRGNGKQDIFYNDKDIYRFLQAIYLSNNSNSFVGIEELERNKRGYTLVEIKNVLENNKIIYDPLVRICADVLMPNHYHFLLQEIQGGGVVSFMQKLGTSYAKYFTTKHDRPGSLFQGRFKAVHIENDDQLKYLLAYINVLNPIKLTIPDLRERGIEDSERAWDIAESYNWSTHQEFMDKRKSILIDKGLLGKIFPTPDVYKNFIKDILKGKERKMWATIDDLVIE